MKDKINYVQVPGNTEPQQLLNLLIAAGFSTVARTTEKLPKTKDGTYSIPLFRINEKNEAIGLSMQESLEVAEDLPKVHSIVNLLANRYMSDIDLVDKHPETGEHHRGMGYVSARIKGILQPYKQVGGVLIQSYIQGTMTEKDVAANVFWPVMVEMAETLAQVAQATKGIEPEMADENTQFIYLHNSVHKDQLRALLKDCGYKLTPDTFRSLTKNDKGHYSNILIKVTNGMAVCLSPEEAEQNIMHPSRKHLHEVLGPKVILDASITAECPLTGLAAKDGGAYLSANIDGETMTPMPIGKTLYDQYRRGQRTALEIASGIFRDTMVDQYSSVMTDVDYGRRWTNGWQTEYYAHKMFGDEFYKDMTAFDEKEGICYISTENWAEYIMDRVCVSRQLKDMSEYGVTYDDIVSHARTLGFRNPGQVARQCLQNCNGQSVFTELQETRYHTEKEDLLDIDEELKDRCNLFVEQHGTTPNYAEVYVEYKDDDESMRAMIALNEEAGEYADDEVMFTCRNMDEFYRLAEEDNGEDFKVTELCGYHRGMKDIEKEIAEEEGVENDIDMDSRDEGATVFEAEENVEERVVRVDRTITIEELRNVFAREGITIDDVLPGIDEPLPLKADGQTLADDLYLRIVDQQVIDYANSYMYQTVEKDNPDISIELLTDIIAEQKKKENSEKEKQISDCDLLRITDVRVFRNPQNKAEMEFRMRCKIDGVQQLGKILTSDQVEELANGADRTRMAAQVFRSKLDEDLYLGREKGKTR